MKAFNLKVPSFLALVALVALGCSTTEPAGTQMSDASITTKIKSQMIADGDVDAHNVDVDTNEGVVTLQGRVDNSEQKMEAERIARECDGVVRVVNMLNVGKATEASAPKK